MFRLYSIIWLPFIILFYSCEPPISINEYPYLVKKNNHQLYYDEYKWYLYNRLSLLDTLEVLNGFHRIPVKILECDIDTSKIDIYYEKNDSDFIYFYIDDAIPLLYRNKPLLLDTRSSIFTRSILYPVLTGCNTKKNIFFSYNDKLTLVIPSDYYTINVRDTSFNNRIKCEQSALNSWLKKKIKTSQIK